MGLPQVGYRWWDTAGPRGQRSRLATLPAGPVGGATACGLRWRGTAGPLDPRPRLATRSRARIQIGHRLWVTLVGCRRSVGPATSPANIEYRLASGSYYYLRTLTSTLVLPICPPTSTPQVLLVSASAFAYSPSHLQSIVAVITLAQNHESGTGPSRSCFSFRPDDGSLVGSSRLDTVKRDDSG